VSLRELMDDRLLDALLERSRDQAGGLRLTAEGSMLGQLVRAALQRAQKVELTAHLGYERHERGGAGNARNGAIAKQAGAGALAEQRGYGRGVGVVREGARRGGFGRGGSRMARRYRPEELSGDAALVAEAVLADALGG
jgi:hypothetical protein